jgi:hypothetical protein
MQCRAVREGTLCSTCGEGLLDLSNETDRMFVRMAIHRPSVADVVAVLVALAVAMVALIGLGPPARWLAGLLQLLAIAAGGMTLAVVRARPFTDFRAPGPIARNGTDRSDRSHEVQSAVRFRRQGAHLRYRTVENDRSARVPCHSERSSRHGRSSPARIGLIFLKRERGARGLRTAPQGTSGRAARLFERPSPLGARRTARLRTLDITRGAAPPRWTNVRIGKNRHEAALRALDRASAG